MAPHSSVLALRIPGTGEPGGLPSMGSHRVGHDWHDSAAAAAALSWTWQQNGTQFKEDPDHRASFICEETQKIDKKRKTILKSDQDFFS